MNEHTIAQHDDAELLRIAVARQRKLMRLILIPLFVVPFIAGMVFAAVELTRGAPAWILLIPLIFVLASLPGWWVLRQQNRGRSWAPGPIRLGGTDRATRRRVSKAVRSGHLPADEPDRGLGLELARSLNATRWRIWLQPFVLLCLVPALFSVDSPLRLVFYIALMIGVFATWVWEWRVLNRVQALLQRADGPDQAVARA